MSNFEKDKVFNLHEKVEKGDKFTTRELAKMYDVSQTLARNKVRDLIDEGKVEFAGKIKKKTMTNENMSVPAYQIVEEG